MRNLPILLFLFALIFVSPVFAAPSLDFINQKVCDRFEDDTGKLAGIMDEVRSRKGIISTRVAFGGIDDNIKAADYQVTFAAEAIAYQRYQKFSSVAELKSNLEVLKNKVLQAKSLVGKAME